MTASQALLLLRGALREAREAVRRNDRERALELLRQLDHAFVQLEQRFAPLVEGVRALGALGELGRALERLATQPSKPPRRR